MIKILRYLKWEVLRSHQSVTHQSLLVQDTEETYIRESKARKDLDSGTLKDFPRMGGLKQIAKLKRCIE